MLFPKFDALAYLEGKTLKRLDALGGLGAQVLPFEKRLSALTDAERERYEERAGIKELEAGMTRRKAEEEALCEIIELRRHRK